MIEVPVYNQAGDKVESIQIDEAKLGGEVNKALLKQALVMYHANQRQGTVKTKGRGEVAGSTRKVYKQKGTGNARTGGIRNPIKVGGGHAKQKRPKEWRQGLPKQARQAATRHAVLSKIQSNEIRVVDSIKIDQPKTKLVVAMYKKLGIERSCLFALEGQDKNIELAARNVDRTTLTTVSQLNAWEIMNARTLLVTKSGLQTFIG